MDWDVVVTDGAGLDAHKKVIVGTALTLTVRRPNGTGDSCRYPASRSEAGPANDALPIHSGPIGGTASIVAPNARSDPRGFSSGSAWHNALEMCLPTMGTIRTGERLNRGPREHSGRDQGRRIRGQCATADGKPRP